MNPSASLTREGKWTREDIIRELLDYQELYGDFTTAAFNPSTAKWRDDPISRERYLAGNPRTGRPWPALNTIKKVFGGSFNDARIACGLPPNTPGPSAHRRESGKHAPIRGVSDRVQFIHDGDARELQAAVRRAEKAEKRVERLTLQLEKVNERLGEIRARRRVLGVELRNMRARFSKASSDVQAMRAELRDVNSSLGAALAHNDALTSAVDAARHAEDRARIELETVLGTAETLRAELDDARERLELVDPDAARAAQEEVRAARAMAAAAGAARDEAENRAVAAERARNVAIVDRDHHAREAAREAAMRADIQRAVAGHDRELSRDELETLRSEGPAGAAVFTQAVTRVARAQGRDRLASALMEAAAAAVRWRDRL